MNKRITLFLITLLTVCGVQSQNNNQNRNADFHKWAEPPPMGWNVDIRWFVENQTTGYYNFKDPKYVLDEYGRYMPAVNRFPSAGNGNGFKPLADYVHSKGLKFGIHLMRGVPTLAVEKKLPVKDAGGVTAADIYSTDWKCPWLGDNYTIVADRPGAQEYYDSLLELYASWGVDFIKVDDICVKYGRTGDESTLAYGGDEIEMLRRAIDRCGRPIVLSLSPGPAMLDKARHLRENANMWRITNDLWDSWDNIMEMFSRCNEWSPYVSEGCYPDCDMLPLGHISIIGCEHGVGDRMCRLSQDEQKTMMSLWCIFRSPLMLGAEMTDLDSWTLSLLTNEEVLKMHKDSRDAHQIERSFDLITWGAHDEEGSCYIALFNVTNWDETFSFDFRKAGLEGYYEVRDLWEREDLGSVDKIVTKVKSHGVKLYKLSKKQV